jgi:CheY-like chemotaxis protein
MDMERSPLGEVLNTVESIVHPAAKGKGVEFLIQEGKDVPAYMKCDGHRLSQCLINLANNAVKFTAEGHVYLKVRLDYHNGEPFVRFDVEDTGIGVAPDVQGRIFESFVQADGKTNRKYGGTGLGLTITKKLVEMMGGRVELDSELGKGSTFSIVLPAGVDVSNETVLDMRRVEEESRHAKKKVEESQRFSGKVLVADDVRTNQLLAKALLEKLGLEVTIVSDGAEAVEAAKDGTYDLIMMDIQMPNMDGYQATHVLKDKKGVSTPIIALTANAMEGDEAKCLAEGCDGYLSKPIAPAKLNEILRRYLTVEGATARG